MKIKSMLLGALALVCACTSGEETKELGVNGVSHGAAARKLQTCGFLLNKDFKENAKYYLCLFSASWCGPCRREMPRIAKAYAESLKADPNIEFIHFSRDNDENKALAWAKEHDVKFPVVKYNGGNPLDLHSRGIPHLFIVDADGKLLEEGHPAKLFTNEKLNALKAGKLAAPETATEKTRKAIAKLFPGWSLDTEVWDHDFAGIQPLIRGKRNVTFVHPKNRETPSVISRTVKLSGNNPCLSLCVASWNDDADFQLSVRVNGMNALTNQIVCTTDAAPWEDIIVPLSDWRGSTAKIEVVFTGYGRWWCEFPNLARVDIVEADVKEGKCEVDGYTWSYRAQNGEATIVAENDGRFSTAVSPCPVGDITIPATLAGAKVTHIGRDAFLDCSALTSVTIPEGVSRIGRGAFHDCTGLKSIKIPSSVKIIERDAFMGCVALSSVSIPEGVTIIDRGAFIRCYGLESIEIPSSVTQIGRDAFCNCGKLTSLIIPSSVQRIEQGAFHGCGALTSVTMRGERPSAPKNIFERCGNLKAIHVPANAKSWAGMKDWCGIPLVFDANGVYCVIDISGGSNAERYPVSYLDSVPKGGWGDEYKTTKIVLRRVDAGTYPMLGNRKVTFTKPFYIGIFELTQKQIKLLSGDNNRKFVFEGDMRPADCLTWDEMRGKNEEFDYPKTKEIAPNSIIGKLRAKTGLVRIDLPTSYQFGCAWNAGTDGRGRDARSTGRHFSNQRDGKGGYTSNHTIVGSYLPNEWGIYDLHGNVWEMCLDYSGKQSAKDERDPVGPVEGTKRQLRGGCWNSVDGFVFCDFVPQNNEANDNTGNHGKHGCRIVINVEAPETATEKTRKVQRRADAERQQQLEALRQIQEELRRQREAKQAEKEVGASGIQTDSKHVTASNVLTGPYGIRVEPDPGCEKGAEYVLKRLVDDYLPAAVRYYGDPFGGKEPSRIYTLNVERNDGKGNRGYTGPSWGSRGDGISQFTIGLAKGSDKWDMDLTLVANKILTVCREDVGFSLYVNDLVRGDAKGIDPVPEIKEKIRKGLAKEGDEKKDVRLRVWREYAPMWAAFEELRARHPKFMLDYCNLKNSRYAESKLPQELSFDQMADLLGEATGENMVELFKKYGVGRRESRKYLLPKISVAQALQGCDFLLNKDFKKNAKYYLCLFSASWCPPCRAEMPRIAKTYAETLKDDPDIELIHFSRDQNDEKALAWAKEHDVKFPVVKPHGGNPLNLKTSGIPHLFIVKADGTVEDEGHPSRVFDLTKVFNALAKSGEETVDGYTWSYWVRNGETTIAPLKGKYVAVSPRLQGHVTIPAKLGNARVTSIGVRAFSYSRGLTSVTIPEGVTRIENHAFSSCSKLSKVSLPTSLTAIDDQAFSECTALGSLAIPPHLKTIGSMAFWRCSNLRSVTIPSGVTSIGSIAFCDCKKLRSVTIPATVTDLGHGAFSECSELKGVDVEAGNGKYESADGVLYTKGKNALVLCPGGVNSVQVPASVNSIWRYAFQGCDKLEKIVVAEDNPAYASADGFLLTKDRKTLVACPGALTELKLPSSLTRIESEACARNENLTAVEIPEGVVSIGRRAFNGCSRLKSVQIPTSVVTMDSGVFERCPELTTITIPSNVRHLGGWTFEGCKGLRSVTLFEGLENIGDYEFWSCTGLTSVVIPASVKRIGRHAFIGCSELTSLTMSGERPNAPNNIFHDCGKLKAIHVSANAKSWAGMKEWQGIPLVFDAK